MGATQETTLLKLKKPINASQEASEKLELLKTHTHTQGSGPMQLADIHASRANMHEHIMHQYRIYIAYW